jgi:hypothetical protein
MTSQQKTLLLLVLPAADEDAEVLHQAVNLIVGQPPTQRTGSKSRTETVCVRWPLSRNSFPVIWSQLRQPVHAMRSAARRRGDGEWFLSIFKGLGIKP